MGSKGRVQLTPLWIWLVKKSFREKNIILINLSGINKIKHTHITGYDIIKNKCLSQRIKTWHTLEGANRIVRRCDGGWG